MRVFRDSDEGQWEQDVMSFALGAAGGLALGVLLSRAVARPRMIGGELRDRARSVARRLRPARLRRLAEDQELLDQLEDTVLGAFLADEILTERGVDIGAISHGVIELSGSVWSETEAHRAVNLANRIPGVRTVLNRLDIESPTSGDSRWRLETERHGETFVHQESRTGGMGRRRQSFETDPDRPDDSQIRREDALAAADRSQFEEEGYAHETSRNTERPEVQSTRTRFDEDELDNQDPHGKHAKVTLDSPQEALNSDARVGDGMKPGTRRRIEEADLSIEERPPRDSEG
ncbi:MAG: BON domain-containing protein [Gemmatimonadota bacterium]